MRFRSRSPRLPLIRCCVVLSLAVVTILSGAPPAVASALDTAGWRSVGPATLGGPIAQSKTHPGFGVLLQDEGAALWVTEDSGTTWRRASPPPGIATQATTARVVIDPADANHWWLGTNLADGSSSAVFETSDAGGVWQQLVQWDEPLSFFGVADADETDGVAGVLTAVTESPADGRARARRSVEHGADWTAESIVQPWIDGIAISGDVLSYTGGDGIWRRSGALADRLSDAVLAHETGSSANQVFAASDGPFVVVASRQQGVFASHDSGVTWARLTAAETPKVMSLDVQDEEIWIDVADHPRAMLVSADGGATFRSMPLPQDETSGQWVNRWPDASLTVSRRFAGVYRTIDDGEHWNRIGVAGVTVYDLLVAGGALFAGTETELARTALPIASSEWGVTGSEGQRGQRVRMLAASADGSVLWRVTDGTHWRSQVQRSADGGASWEEMLESSVVPTSLFVHPADPSLIVLGGSTSTDGAPGDDGSGCVRLVSRDGGGTWAEGDGSCERAIVGDPDEPRRLWFGGPLGVARSEDAGVTSSTVSSAPTAALLLDGNQLVAGGDSVHLGESSAEQTVALPGGGTVSSLLRVGPRLFAGVAGPRTDGSSGAVLLSEDNGRNWHEAASGIADVEVTALAASPDGSALYAATRLGAVRELSVAALPPVGGGDGPGAAGEDATHLVATGVPAVATLLVALALSASGSLFWRARRRDRGERAGA